MKKKIFYGWWIVLATSIICMIGYGTWLYCFGVFFKPMASEFGWTRAETAGAYSFRGIQGGLSSPIVGWAVDKYGSRGVIVVGAIVAGFAFALMPVVHSLVGFYLVYGLLLSVGMSSMLYLPAWTVIAKWFRRRLSLAMAVLAVGAGVGGFVCAPASAFLIAHFGWRSAFVVLGAAIWIVAIPLAFVVRNSPEEMGLRPEGDAPIDWNCDGVQTKAYTNGSCLDYTTQATCPSVVYRTTYVPACGVEDVVSGCGWDGSTCTNAVGALITQRCQ